MTPPKPTSSPSKSSKPSLKSSSSSKTAAASPTSVPASRKLAVAPSSGESPLPLPEPLSVKEKSVLEFLEDYLRLNGVSPTYQEICRHFGFASFNSVQRYLKQLEAKGYIQLPWANQKRAIKILHSASALQEAIKERSPETSAPGDSVLPAILPTESLQLPLLGRVAAGAPIEALEHDEFIDVPASLVRYADRTYALRVQGQSMIDDGILDGDTILVERRNTAQNGEIVVAVVGEEATVKRFYAHRGVKNIPREAIESVFERMGSDDHSGGSLEKLIELRPANSTMAPMWFEPSEVQIRGVVVGLIRRFV